MEAICLCPAAWVKRWYTYIQWGFIQPHKKESLPFVSTWMDLGTLRSMKWDTFKQNSTCCHVDEPEITKHKVAGSAKVVSRSNKTDDERVMFGGPWESLYPRECLFPSLWDAEFPHISNLWAYNKIPNLKCSAPCWATAGIPVSIINVNQYRNGFHRSICKRIWWFSTGFTGFFILYFRVEMHRGEQGEWKPVKTHLLLLKSSGTWAPGNKCSLNVTWKVCPRVSVTIFTSICKPKHS